MSIKYFDTLDYVRKAKELKVPEVLAEYQVTKMEATIETAVHYVKEDFHPQIKDLPTRIELKKKSTELKYEMLKYMIRAGVGIVVTLGGTLGGLMTHGFHWI